MKIFSIDVRIVATAYIKADSEEEALALARGMRGGGIEISSRHQAAGDNICFDGGAYSGLADNDEDIALSPAMTIAALCGEEDGTDGVSFVEEIEDKEGAADV